MSTHTPPPPPPAGSAPQQHEPRRSGATKPVMIIIAVIGGLTIAFLLLTTLFSAISGLARGTTSQAAPTNGVTALDINSNAARVTVDFDNVSEASLDVTGRHAGQWKLTRQQDTLVVDGPNMWWSWCWFNCQETTVTLVLPEHLSDGTLDAEIDVSAGSLSATGTFNTLSVELNAGEVSVDGTATNLQAEVNAGDAHLGIRDVEHAALEVSAGRLETHLTGTAPTTTEIEVNAGQLIMTLPDDEYLVTSDVAAGNLSNTLRAGTDAANRITVELSAGEVRLDPAP